MMRKKPIPKTKLCFECSVVESNGNCQECEKVYCSSCFTRVHQGKIMKSHKLIIPEKLKEEPWQFGHVLKFLEPTTKGIEVSK